MFYIIRTSKINRMELCKKATIPQMFYLDTIEVLQKSFLSYYYYYYLHLVWLITNASCIVLIHKFEWLGDIFLVQPIFIVILIVNNFNHSVSFWNGYPLRSFFFFLQNAQSAIVFDLVFNNFVRYTIKFK